MADQAGTTETPRTIIRIPEGVEAPPAGEWRLDPAHSSFGFVARHLMVTKVRGHFNDFTGTIHIAERPEDSWAEATVKAASIDTGTADRDAHLRSPDFLDVERFPELTFRTTKIEQAEGNRLRVTGDLTIRDVTRPVTLDVEFEGLTPDPWGETRAVFTITGEIDREGWGMTWNKVMETGRVLVSKKVQLDIEATGVLQKPQA